MIVKCNKQGGCTQHEFQDKEYGEGWRLMNDCKKVNGKYSSYRCTVCGNVIGNNDAQVKGR